MVLTVPVDHLIPGICRAVGASEASFADSSVEIVVEGHRENRPDMNRRHRNQYLQGQIHRQKRHLRDMNESVSAQNMSAAISGAWVVTSMTITLVICIKGDSSRAALALKRLVMSGLITLVKTRVRLTGKIGGKKLGHRD